MACLIKMQQLTTHGWPVYPDVYLSQRDKAEPVTLYLELFKQTWPSLSSACHGPWKGPRRSLLTCLSLPVASKDARLSQTDTKMEWATRWQNRNRRLVSRIEPFYPQRKIRRQTGGDVKITKKKKKKERKLRLLKAPTEEISRWDAVRFSMFHKSPPIIK